MKMPASMRPGQRHRSRLDQIPDFLTTNEFREAFGEPLERTLNLETWLPGEDLARLYERLAAEVRTALDRETSVATTIRKEVLPRLSSRKGAPPGAGIYRVALADLERVHRSILFNGAVEAADGIAVSHDTLAITITQIGVCLVSFRGDSGSWVHRLFRRDLRTAVPDPVDEAIALVERRQRHTNLEEPDRLSRLSQLARRGILAYAERAVLLDRSTAPWRMGHGNPVPYELLTGSGSMDLLEASLCLIARLVGEQRKFVFVPTYPAQDRGLITIGHALNPLEYAVVDTMTERLREISERGHYDRRSKQLLRDFVETFGPQLLIGLYRAAQAGPPQLFFAHADYVHEAALIAMADSALQEHRAFPTLLDLAAVLCRTIFGAGDFNDSVRVAYADAGHPFRYLDGGSWSP